MSSVFLKKSPLMFCRRAKIKRREDLADESIRRPSGLKIVLRNTDWNAAGHQASLAAVLVAFQDCVPRIGLSP